MKTLLLALAVLGACGGEDKSASEIILPTTSQSDFPVTLKMVREKTTSLVKDTSLKITPEPPGQLETPVTFSVWTKSLLGQKTDSDVLKVPNIIFDLESRKSMIHPIEGSEMTVTPAEVSGDCINLIFHKFKKPGVKIVKADILWCLKIEEVTLTSKIRNTQILLGYKR